MRLSATYHPIPYLLERISTLLPGVVEKSAVWLDYDKQLYFSFDDSPITGEQKMRTQTLRSIKESSVWTNQINPFKENNLIKSQLSFEDEDSFKVLKLAFPSPIDGKMDLLLLGFSPSTFLKSLNLEYSGFSAQEKNFTEAFIYNFLHSEYQRIVKENAILLTIENVHNSNKEEKERLKEKLKATTQLYTSSIESILLGLIAKEEKKLKRTFILHPEIISLIAKEGLDLEAVEKTIIDAIYLAYNINFSSDTIEITKEYIQLNKVQKETKTIRISSGVNDRVIQLLDRYEEAALKLVESNLVVNGKNLASRLDPPVTPPAITDIVKKNTQKITYMLQQFPNRWENIRTSIRPIARLDENRSSSSVG